MFTFQTSRFKRAVILIPLACAALLALSGCGILDSHDESGVSSSLVDYLYPNPKQRGGLSAQVDPAQARQTTLPQITIPARVGIAFVPTQTYRHNPLSLKTQMDLLNQTKARFAAYPFVEHIEVIPSNYLQTRGGFTNLEQVARLYDVDIMALVSYDQVQKSYLRDSSFLYLTVVGAYVIKGEANETQTFVDTSVFDVRSRKLLFRAPGTNYVAKNSSATDQHREQGKLAAQGFNEAMAEMVGNLDTELSLFKERVKNEKVAEISYKPGYAGGGGSFSWVFLVWLGLFGMLKWRSLRGTRSSWV